MGDTPAPSGTAWGSFIQAHLRRKGWTVTRLAEETRRVHKTGIARQTLSDYINQPGSDAGLRFETAMIVVDAFGDVDPTEALRAGAGISNMDHEDPEIRAVLDMHLPPVAERAFIDAIMAQRERDRQRRLQDMQTTAEMIRLAESQETG